MSSAKSTDHGNDVMMAQFAFLFLSRASFRETSREMDVKIVNGMEITNGQQFYMVCTLIDHTNDVKMSKTLSFEHVDVISMVDKNTDHGKLLSICFLQ